MGIGQQAKDVLDVVEKCCGEPHQLESLSPEGIKL